LSGEIDAPASISQQRSGSFDVGVAIVQDPPGSQGGVGGSQETREGPSLAGLQRRPRAPAFVRADREPADPLHEPKREHIPRRGRDRSLCPPLARIYLNGRGSRIRTCGPLLPNQRAGAHFAYSREFPRAWRSFCSSSVHAFPGRSLGDGCLKLWVMVAVDIQWHIHAHTQLPSHKRDIHAPGHVQWLDAPSTALARWRSVDQSTSRIFVDGTCSTLQGGSRVGRCPRSRGLARRARPVGRAYEVKRCTLCSARRQWPARQAVRGVRLHAHKVRRLPRLVSLSWLRPALPCPLRHQQPALP
jgi:hypothetical protein